VHLVVINYKCAKKAEVFWSDIMNILFEIADKDIMFIGLFGVGIILFGVIIFYVLSKGEKEEIEVFDDVESLEEEEDMFENIKPKTKEQKEAKDELERVFKQMSDDLEEKNKAPKAIEKFEQEQEENAIISYQELIKQAEVKRNYPNEDFEKIEKKVEDVIEVTEEKPKKEKKQKKEEKKFKNSEIISPIFGVQSPDEYKEELREKELKKENSKDLKVAYEENDNIDFLKSLKEFRNNL